MKEAVRYLDNAKEILGKSAIENDQYLDDKYVKSACGVAYLGVLKAVDEFLLRKGISKKELPKKVDEYRKALQKHVSVHDGKLLRQFENIYDELHIAGYYRGILHSVPIVKAALKSAENFVKKIGA
ncbi:MAG: DUF5618 family protein [Thermodesulfobacteriota bacterium]